MAPYAVLPDDMMFHLLTFLTWSDLLRFRRVSKKAKRITNDFIGTNKGRLLIPEIEINAASERSMSAYLLIGIPAPKLYLNNQFSPPNDLLTTQSEAILHFAKLYGNNVTHLKMNGMTLSEGTEWKFLDALQSLKSLQVENFRPNLKTILEIATSPKCIDKYLPKSFKALKSLNLRVKSEKGSGHLEPLDSVSAMALSLTLLKHCDQLEYYAGSSHIAKFWDLMAHYQIKPFMVITDAIFKHFNHSNLKTVDFSNCIWDKNEPQLVAHYHYLSGEFLGMNQTCLKSGLQIRFENVPAHWFLNTLPSHGNRINPLIVSMVNLHQSVFSVNLPNLERIHVNSTAQSALAPNYRRPIWNNLKYLDITVDSKYMKKCILLDAFGQLQETLPVLSSSLLKFFFNGVRHNNLVELRLSIDKPRSCFPEGKQIALACPNLKKITLRRWPRGGTSLSSVWVNLPGLEEINLENCTDLGNSAFFGCYPSNNRKPDFLNLKHLRRLSIKGCNTMPKINDDLFRFVFAKLALTHFRIECRHPLINVTPAGILSLLDGRFAKTIEKFPFHCWSIGRVDKIDFKNLEKKFRSYKMI